MWFEAIYPDLVLTEEEESRSAILESNFLNLPIVMKWEGDKVVIEKRDFDLDTGQEEKEVPKINRAFAEGVMEVLGPAEGRSFFQCWYMAVKYGEKFYERVSAYAVTPPKKAGSVAIVFYGSRLPVN